VDGLRVTDKETVDLAQMVLAGKINKSLVNFLEMIGGKAMGISGIDGKLIEAKMKDVKLGYVGDITKINIQPVNDLLENGYIPVISTIGCDKEGNVYNINGDTAAAHIAGALKAKRLIMLTDIAGILKDKDDPSTLISELTVAEAKHLFADGTISGGMVPKVECCIEAIEHGVRKVVILDGRVPHAILLELLTDEGSGTLVKEA
ncbi:MAG TPA: acetylglutamate kinase, partial [Methanocorpusculum sp.]|nr:acetylglutamate kinase [Methanocorpusculum sp.]